uniref:Putative vacuolar amino acid transporter YPQ1 isoform X1 n=1 Tax=Davidia involucrata TaxID=16924 RepID=A0A5B6YI97_DAVIN
MKPLPDSLSYCVKEKKACVGWVEKYFKDCLCNVSDDFSFAFGLISLVCWGVAEIPQIITNFRTKSSHGVSLLFLLTWVAGDAFNLVGCLLEPATLPTQFYTALLYTVSTVVLVLQGMYYDYIYRLWKYRQIEVHQVVEEEKKPLKPPKSAHPGIPITDATPKAFYYTSARSLAGSNTPPIRSYLTARSGPSAMGFDNDSSSEDEPIQVSSKKSVSQPKPIPRSAGYGAFLATSLNFPQRSVALMQVYAGFSGRRLLHEHGMESNAYGQLLGWLMAAIYMGGRIPQICLNIKRGSVEGLNPLMFIFALIANVTYVASL